jgi:hypothetical protein
MSDYQLTATDATVIRTADGACIPNDPANRDWVEYQEWLAKGGVPDPYVAPPPTPPEADPQTTTLYDHENRLRAIEGAPPITVLDFVDKMRSGPAAPAPKSKRDARTT